MIISSEQGDKISKNLQKGEVFLGQIFIKNEIETMHGVFFEKQKLIYLYLDGAMTKYVNIVSIRLGRYF